VACGFQLQKWQEPLNGPEHNGVGGGGSVKYRGSFKTGKGGVARWGDRVWRSHATKSVGEGYVWG